MPEAIFGISPVEALLVIGAIVVLSKITQGMAWKVVDIVMEMMPLVLVVVIVCAVLFTVLWLYRQGPSVLRPNYGGLS